MVSPYPNQGCLRRRVSLWLPRIGYRQEVRESFYKGQFEHVIKNNNQATNLLIHRFNCHPPDSGIRSREKGSFSYRHRMRGTHIPALNEISILHTPDFDTSLQISDQVHLQRTFSHVF